MSTEPASVLHRFVSLANEPDYLAIGRMREGPLKPPVQNFGVWLIWPCMAACPSSRPRAPCADPLTNSEFLLAHEGCGLRTDLNQRRWSVNRALTRWNASEQPPANGDGGSEQHHGGGQCGYGNRPHHR
jgi:hypothetical protein